MLSTGTYLNSQRFRVHLGKFFGVDARSVEAQVIGDRGTSQVFLWCSSSARIAGVPIAALLKVRGQRLESVRDKLEQEVRYAKITIIEGYGASQYGIGIVAVRIAEMILSIIPIGSSHEDLGVTLSLPSIVGRSGRSVDFIRHCKRSGGRHCRLRGERAGRDPRNRQRED